MEDTLSSWYFERSGISTCGDKAYTITDGPEWLSVSADVLTITSSSYEDEPTTESATVTVSLLDNASV